ncbi:MAG: GtrA family protein [Hyphomicrobiales bacterium]|nr:GtrA family protein [Hyphomicrobiales bacterium]
MNELRLGSHFAKSIAAKATLLRFLAVGGAATLGYILVCYFLQTLCGWPPFWASAVAYLAMVGFAYLAQRNFTFRSSRHHLISLPLYAALQSGCGLFAAVTVQVLVTTAQISALSASTVAAALSAAASYVISSSWIFSDRPGK